MDKKNIFNEIPSTLPEELFSTLVSSNSLKVERIVSKGHSSPPDFWYEQEENEFVILLRGGATLKFEGEESHLKMSPGDYVNIPAKVKHRLEWSDPKRESIWLAIFY